MGNKKFIFGVANGEFKAEGKDYLEACANLGKKHHPDEFVTGYLVRIKEDMPNVSHAWSYWDSEQFWKYLKGKQKRSRK